MHRSTLSQIVGDNPLDGMATYIRLFKALTEQFEMPVLFAPIQEGSVVYRTRKNEEGIDFCVFDDLSFPPPDRVTRFSRANKPFQSVFYGSDNFATTMGELIPSWNGTTKVGQTFAVTTAQWETMQPIRLAVILDHSNRRLMEQFAGVPSLSSGNDDVSYWKDLSRYFHAQGVTDSDVYTVTSAFCNALLHNAEALGEAVDGILYTSAQDNEGWNVALRPESASAKLRLMTVVKHLISRRRSELGMPTYDNFVEPIMATKLDHRSKRIVWAAEQS
jgi:hypothetical protein